MKNWMDNLERAKALLDAGALTPEEFEREKARILSEAPQLKFNDNPTRQHAKRKASPKTSYATLAILSLVAVTAGIGGYVLYGQDRISPPTTKSADAPEKSNVTTTGETENDIAYPPVAPAVEKSAKEVAQNLDPEVKTFECLGAYSNVSFSDESGDASGLFINIRSVEDIKWIYYEGGPSRGRVKPAFVTGNSIEGAVFYGGDVFSDSSTFTLTCSGRGVAVSTDGFGTLNLRKLSRSQAAELDR